jgi:NhaP-type Na+/H+ or K+/H+ antiporter
MVGAFGSTMGAGFRGGVSLAAALAVPVTVVDGSRFPGRDLIVLVTFGVILVTLLAQGLTLPRCCAGPDCLTTVPRPKSNNWPSAR